MDRHELEEKTGMPIRTIRYLIENGIVPTANGVRRGAFYDESHVNAALRYKQLQAEGITSLAAIKERMAEEAGTQVLEIAPGLELHFKETAVSYHNFMMSPAVLTALEVLKSAIERK